MNSAMTRRTFLQSTATLASTAAFGLAGPSAAGENSGRIKKAVKYHMIKEDFSIRDKFKLLMDLGFDGVEIATNEKVSRKEVARARDVTGLPVHGVINSSRPDLKAAIDLSKYYGGTSVLVVAGRVNKDNSYDENYRGTQEWIRGAVDYAEQQQIKLLVENVWNNFLLSPLEMARYIDAFDSPWVGVYFDVGNVVRFGWPQHWIRILRERIGKLDIKEYSRKRQRDEGLWKGFDVEIGEGDCDWPEVRAALREIGFEGWATAEVRGGDRQRLTQIAERMNHVLKI